MRRYADWFLLVAALVIAALFVIVTYTAPAVDLYFPDGRIIRIHSVIKWTHLDKQTE